MMLSRQMSLQRPHLAEDLPVVEEVYAPGRLHTSYHHQGRSSVPRSNSRVRPSQHTHTRHKHNADFHS